MLKPFLLSLSFSILLLSCKKEEKKEEINYNQINQERLLGNWVLDSVLYGVDSTARFPNRYQNISCDSLEQAQMKLFFRFTESTVTYDECSNFGSLSTYKTEYTIWDVKADSVRMGNFSNLYWGYLFQFKNDSSLVLSGNDESSAELNHYYCSKQ